MFDIQLKNTFEVFSRQHLIPVIIILLIVGLLFLYREWFQRKLLWVPKALAVITILQHFALFLYRVNSGIWDVSKHLPFYLCSVGVYFSSYVLWTKDKRAFHNTFFVLFFGAFLAILFPEITDKWGYPHFRYFQFFISHSLIMINISYALFVFDYAKDFKYIDIYKNMMFVWGFAVISLVANLLTNGNYLWLMHSPEDSIFELFGMYPTYIFTILFIIFPIGFNLFYIPFYFYNKSVIKKGTEVPINLY